ncbi:MAG: TetR/AcrR family transcriptional regulator [Pseudomonadota bacterium]
MKRGRPPTFDRQAALTTARRLFHEKGYEGVGVAELGAAMGIKAPSLYAAFGNKKNLYALALDEYIAASGTWIAEALAQEGALAPVIAALFDQAATRYSTPSDPPGCMVMNGTSGAADQSICDLARERCSKTQDLVGARVRLSTSTRVEPLTDYVMLILHGLSASARAGASRSALRRAADAAARGFAALIPDP